MTIKLKFRDGFKPELIAWGRPDSTPRPLCSYCHALLSKDDVPLMMWANDGLLAQFCEQCTEKWIIA